MIPNRFKSILFSFFLSIFMTFIVSGVSSFTAVGLTENLLYFWPTAWYRSWIIAFPAMLIIAPITRNLVSIITK